MVRTLLIDLEQRCEEVLSVTEDLLPWLLEHACDLLNRYKGRKGNKTAWEFIKGEPYSGDIYIYRYSFGTLVMHRMSGVVQWGRGVAERWCSRPESAWLLPPMDGWSGQGSPHSP